jgi:hypothetical protein
MNLRSDVVELANLDQQISFRLSAMPDGGVRRPDDRGSNVGTESGPDNVPSLLCF